MSPTRVEQRMQYELKLGTIGSILDALFVRRKRNAGIRAFFVDLKGCVEAAESAAAPAA